MSTDDTTPASTAPAGAATSPSLAPAPAEQRVQAEGAVPAPPAPPSRPGEPDEPGEPRRRAGRRSRAIVYGVVAAIVVAGGLLAWSAVGDRSTALEQAYQACAPEPKDGDDSTPELPSRVTDGGRTLIVDTDDQYDFVGYFHMLCLLEELDTPERVTTQIGATRALDGRQSDSWDHFTATWSYHPDNGLDLMVVED